MASYTMNVTVDLEPAKAEERVKEALAEEGFGILSEIDVQAALREKVGEDVGHYTILGACNPPLANRAVAADPDIGALLPCNVLVRQAPGGGAVIAAADPEEMLGLASRADLDELAEEARARIRRALDAVAG